MTLTSLIITKIWSHKKSETESSFNKNDPQSSLENSGHTKLNELNSKWALLQSFFSEQFIYIKKSLQEINDLYQRNENSSTYALIKQVDDLKEEKQLQKKDNAVITWTQ